MRSILALIILLASVLQAQAGSRERVQKFIEIQTGQSLYVDWLKALPGHDTVILLNGLTYETPSWDALVSELEDSGLGVLRYDPRGMGETLILEKGARTAFKIDDQARDLEKLTRKIGLTGKLNLVGLSYGGGLATAFAGLFPQRLKTAILMGPYTEPLAGQDAVIRSQIAGVRFGFPLNPATDEELYEFFLRQNVYYQFPLSEPSMLKHPYKPEAVFQLTQGIRKYDMKKASQNFPSRSVHLIIAGVDQYIPRSVLENFWKQLPANSRASKVLVEFSEHKLPEAVPATLAGLIKLMIGPDKKMKQGRSFIVDPAFGGTKELPAAN